MSVHKLEYVTYEALSSWFKDPENPENIFRRPLIRELFKVAKYEERYKNGEIGKFIYKLWALQIAWLMIFRC